MKVASFTGRATVQQSARWKQAAESEGFQSAGAWLAGAADAYLKIRAKAGLPVLPLVACWRLQSAPGRRGDGSSAGQDGSAVRLLRRDGSRGLRRPGSTTVHAGIPAHLARPGNASPRSGLQGLGGGAGAVVGAVGWAGAGATLAGAGADCGPASARVTRLSGRSSPARFSVWLGSRTKVQSWLNDNDRNIDHIDSITCDALEFLIITGDDLVRSVGDGGGDDLRIGFQGATLS